MSLFDMRLYWKIGEISPPDPGLIPIGATELEGAVAEADKIWFKCNEVLEPKPFGYLIYDRPSGKIVYETQLGEAVPLTVRGPETEAPPAKRRLRRWPWLLSR